MGSQKSMIIRQAHRDHALRKKAISVERIERVKAITAAWKDGFNALKIENDRLQDDLMDWYSDEHGKNDEKLRNEISMASD